MQRRTQTLTVDSESLKKWAIDDLGVPGLSGHADLSHVCRWEMGKVWQYMMDNITSQETAKVIRTQLQRHSVGISSPDRAISGRPKLDEKVKRYNLLVQQRKKLQSKLSLLEDSVRLHQTELSEQSTSLQKKTGIQRDNAVKSCLLVQHRDVLANQLQVVEGFRNALQDFIDKNDPQRWKENDASASAQNLNLAQLRQLQENVVDFLLSLLEGSVNKSSLQDHKSKIKSCLSRLLSTAGFPAILKYIIHDTGRATVRIVEDTATIDHVEDANKLRFRIVEEGLVDESTEPSLLMGVNQLIEQRQLEHQERFLDTVTHRDEAKLLNQKMVELRNKVYSRLSSDGRRDKKHAIIKEILDKMIEESQAQATLRVVRSVIAQRQQQMVTSSEQLLTLKRKRATISRFRTDVQGKQNQICVLMKQNMSWKEKLSNKQALTLSTVDTLKSNEESRDLLSSTTLPADYTSQTKQLLGLSLHWFSSNPHTVLRGLHCSSGKASKDLECLAQHLQFKHFLANDALLRTILEKKMDILKSYARIPTTSDTKEVRLANEISNRLLPEAKQQSDHLLRELVPRLQSSKVAVDGSQAKCDKVHKLIDVWCQQPALELDLST